jgi:thiamine-phosphate pyrophosphorylase
MRGLYAILDLDAAEARGIAPLELARRLLAARLPLMQLRAKHAPARRSLELLRALRPLCTSANTLLFANDRPDLALLSGADGVHLGQEDLPIEEVRRIAPGCLVGISTHDPEELARALAGAPDYVAYGPVFPTGSKQRPDPVVGLDGLAAAAAMARSARVPLVAIGGIDLERAPLVARHADLAAVIGGLLPPDGDFTERARALHRALGGTA